MSVERIAIKAARSGRLRALLQELRPESLILLSQIRINELAC